MTSVSSDGQVKVWTHKGTEITTLQPHKERVNACEIWAQFTKRQNENEMEWSANSAEVRTVQQKVRAFKPSDLNDVVVFTASDDGTVQSQYPFKVTAQQMITLFKVKNRNTRKRFETQLKFTIKTPERPH